MYLCFMSLCQFLCDRGGAKSHVFWMISSFAMFYLLVFCGRWRERWSRFLYMERCLHVSYLIFMLPLSCFMFHVFMPDALCLYVLYFRVFTYCNFDSSQLEFSRRGKGGCLYVLYFISLFISCVLMSSQLEYFSFQEKRNGCVFKCLTFSCLFLSCTIMLYQLEYVSSMDVLF